MAREEVDPKIGAGHASAMFRQGLSELRGAFYNDSNVAQPAQYGLYGTKTPGEVMRDRGSEGRDLEEQPDAHGSPTREAAVPAREDLGRERD